MDRLGEAMTRCYLLRLGESDDGLRDLVDELDMPSLRANWLLAMAAHDRAPDPTRSELEQSIEHVSLPFSIHLRVLAYLERPVAARTLVRSVAERIPQRALRRRFLAEWSSGARI